MDSLVEGARFGAYVLIRPIGSGGMGEVWMAEHVMLGRRAAIKMLHESFSSRPEIVARFFNEARAATALDDPGIVQIFDFGHVDKTAFIVMELLQGEPLDRRLARLGALPIGDAVRLIRQVATTLGVAHTRGIVHRDLKPENLFVVRDAEVPGGERCKILDFGIAKLSGDNVGVKTQTAAVMGTPVFMSPEQCRGAGEVDQRADVYSLGCVLFTLIAGRPPFVADGAGELIAMHLREQAPRVISVVPHVPVALDAVIARCLAKDAATRYATGNELASALAAIVTGGPEPVAPGAQSSAWSTSPTPPTTLSTAAGVVATPSPPRRRSRLVVAVTSLVAAIVAVGVSVSIATSHPEPARTSTASPVVSTTPPDAAVAPVIIDAGVTAAPPVDASPADARPLATPPAPRPKAPASAPAKPPAPVPPPRPKQPDVFIDTDGDGIPDSR